VAALAGRFRLGAGRIAEAVVTAVAEAGKRAVTSSCPSDTPMQSAVQTEPTEADLFAAARAQNRHHLAALARHVEPVATWDDLVLPANAVAQLGELCRRSVHAQRVWGQWGFARKYSYGRGTTALFSGPPGTGKTMAAEVVAGQLGLDLFKVDLSLVISKYIGKTEKNLGRIFTAAAASDAILMFDEADALFGKRSEVRDSHDRYANVEVSYLLQQMEEYDGIAILATNLRQNLDHAFLRRLQFVVEFPFPDEVQRARIWRACFPPDTPRDECLDFDGLGRDFRLAGGSIRNVVLHAAFCAADADAPVGRDHLLRALRREHEKLGEVLPDAVAGRA